MSAQPTPGGPAPAASDGAALALNRRFATLARWGARLALLAMLVSFALYVTGVLPPLVALQRVPGLLYEGSDVFMRQQAMPPGWSWLRHVGRGDLLTLASLVALQLVVMVAYVGAIPLLLRRRDWVYLGLVLLQLLVFALAAGLPTP